MKVAITARVRNADLWEAGQKVGGFPALAKRLNVPYSLLISWLNFRVYPTYRNPKSLYDWEHIEKELLELTGKLLEDIFPPELANSEFLQQEKTRTVFQDIEVISLTGIKGSLSLPPAIDSEIEKQEQSTTIAHALEKLRPRDRQVLEMRFGLNGDEEMTLQEIANHFNLNRERVRQIEARGLRALRHPTLAKKLKAFHKD